jgi:hypothetical protein
MVLVLLMTLASTASASSLYLFTLDNVVIDGNPEHTVTGSLIFDDYVGPVLPGMTGNPFSNIAVQAITPESTIQLNSVWTTSSGPTSYLGLSNAPHPAPDDLAIIFIFSTDLRESALAGVPNQLVPLGGGSNFIPGGSAFGPLLDIINGFPEERLLRVSGAFVPSASLEPVPLPGAFPLFATCLGLAGLLSWRRRSRPAPASR